MTANLHSKPPKISLLCLSPHCPAPSFRVFSSAQTPLHTSCRQWFFPQTHILQLQPMDFDPVLPLEFATAPLQTQAYLHLNRLVIAAYLSQLVDTLRSSLLLQVDLFAAAVRTLREQLFLFPNYPKILQIAELTKLPHSVRSQQLAQALGKGLPFRPNTRLPSFRSIKQIVQRVQLKLNQLILASSLLPIQDDDTKPLEEAETIRLEDEEDEDAEEEAEGGGEEGERGLGKESEEKRVREYLEKEGNLGTALQLMKRPLTSFLQFDKETKQTKVKCLYCAFTISLHTASKQASKSEATSTILSHLFHCHYELVRRYYQGQMQRQRTGNEVSLQEIVKRCNQNSLRGVWLVETAVAYFFQQIQGPQPHHLVVEVAAQAAETNFPILRNSQPDQMPLLLGYLIHALSAQGKTLHLCCLVDRVPLLQAFCASQQIHNLKVTVGKCKKATKKQLSRMRRDSKPENDTASQP